MNSYEIKKLLGMRRGELVEIIKDLKATLRARDTLIKMIMERK